MAALIAAGCGDAPTRPLFENITEQAGAGFQHKEPAELKGFFPMGTGAAFADCDEDGWLDLLVTNRDGPNALFRNNGDGTFTDIAVGAGLADPDGDSSGAAFADYDNDGHADVYVGRNGSNRLFHGLGGCRFDDVTDSAGVSGAGNTQGIAWGDYDGDGWVDFYYANHTAALEFPPPASEPDRDDRLYHNNGDGSFTDVSALLPGDERLGTGFAPTFFDADRDGDPDLYLVNDFVGGKGNIFWRNDGQDAGDWVFTDASARAGLDYDVEGMGVAVGDYDNDGDPDLTFSNIGDVSLLSNDGAGVYKDVAREVGIDMEAFTVTWGTALADFDNDGWLDLYYAAGGLTSALPYPLEQGNLLYLGREGGAFERDFDGAAVAAFGSSRTVAWGDVNNDGFLDLFVVNYDGAASLMAGGPNGNGWLIVDPVGTASNRSAIGARVTLHLADGRTLTREITSGSSLGAGNDVAAYFGLGSAATIDRLEIRWPSGRVQSMTSVETRQRLVIVEE